ncbi:MAG TPA: DUF2846 domain-containing protein [Mariprofundaceae bacterium]|nr:DUF2846 domain-containing protein [Mariprofundaceae bacterium]
MKGKYLVAISMAIVGLLSGCAGKQLTHEEMKKEIAGYQLPAQASQDKALVYVVRPSSLGGAVRFNVYLDDKQDESEMGYTRGGQYIYFYADPGSHMIRSLAENWAEIELNLEAGKVFFIQQNPEMGLMFARNSLFQIQQIEGTYEVKQLKEGTIKKTSK